MHRGLATRAHLDPVGSWMLPVAGRVAAKNGSWFFSSSGLNCQSHSSALLRKPPGHGRTVLLHSAAGGHRRAEALTAGGLAMTATPSDSQEILLLVFLRTSESQNAWRCFAQTIFIVVIIICLSCSSARCRSEICNSAEDAGRRQAVQPRRSKKARGRGTHTRRTGMWTHCGSSRARGSLKGCKAVGPRLRRMWGAQRGASMGRRARRAHPGQSCARRRPSVQVSQPLSVCRVCEADRLWFRGC